MSDVREMKRVLNGSLKAPTRHNLAGSGLQGAAVPERIRARDWLRQRSSQVVEEGNKLRLVIASA